MKLSEEKRAKIKAQMEKILEKYGETSYNDTGLDTILDEWEKNKGWLIDKLSTHPNYDSEKLWITIDAKVGGELDTKKLNEEYLYIKNYLNNIFLFDEYGTEYVFRELMYTGGYGGKNYKVKPYISQRAIDKILNGKKDFMGVHMKEGEKTISVIIKLIKELGIIENFKTYTDKNGKEKSEYYKWEARVSDLFACKEKTEKIYLSANPIDYLTMSAGVSWSSCYLPGEGCYRAGLLSYMCDPSTLIAYTTNEDDVCGAYKKINRQCWFIGKEGSAIQNRMYPQNESNSLYKYYEWGDAISQEIGKIFNINYHYKEYKSKRAYESVPSDVVGYVDMFNEFAYIGYFENETNEKIQVAQRQYFIDSDNIYDAGEFDNDETLSYKCRECCECGSTEALHLIDGAYYCEDCCFYCDYHDRWEIGEYYYVEAEGIDVCEGALGNGFVYCENCHRVERDYVAVYVNGKSFCCADCAYDAGYRCVGDDWYSEDDVFSCDMCGENALWEDRIETEDGNYYCCEECAGKDGYIKNNNGEWVKLEQIDVDESEIKEKEVA